MREMIMTEKEIQIACQKLGKQITEDLKNEEKVPVVVGVLKGALHFMCDLVKHIDTPVILDYVQISSYYALGRTGSIVLSKDISQDIKDRTVIIVEDVIDSGLSMSFLLKHIEKNFQPKNIYVCALFDKVNAREAEVDVKYSGKILTENKFLVGYGLDYKELHRNTPYVFIPDEEDIKYWDSLVD